LTEGYHVN